MVEFSQVRHGAALDYLSAVREVRVPLLADYGYSNAGLYEVAFRRTEVCTLWVGDVDAQVAAQRARDAALGLDAPGLADERFLRWDEISRDFLSGQSRELMLAAYPGPALSV
jgi:hypothetical protein